MNNRLLELTPELGADVPRLTRDPQLRSPTVKTMSEPLESLKSFKLLCFDCYGTIVDWENAINDRLQPLITKSSSTRAWTKKETLEAFGSVEMNLQTKYPSKLYSEILELCYKELANRLEIQYDELESEAKTFGSSVQYWKPFPDSVDALVRLQKHYKMVILSNVDKTSFSATQENLAPFVPDLVLTAQEIGTYKPNEQNFHYMLAAIKEQFGVEPHEVLVTAQSLIHDHQPAHALGLKGAWITREGIMGAGELAKDVKYEFEFPTLGDMARALESC